MCWSHKKYGRSSPSGKFFLHISRSIFLYQDSAVELNLATPFMVSGKYSDCFFMNRRYSILKAWSTVMIRSTILLLNVPSISIEVSYFSFLSILKRMSLSIFDNSSIPTFCLTCFWTI